MRLSRGRSTPTRRAMWRCSFRQQRCGRAPRPCPPRCFSRFTGRAPASVPGATSRRFGLDERARVVATVLELRRAWSALPLLVPRVLADHHDPAVTPDHLALVADLLDARIDLHRASFFGSVNGWSVVLARGRRPPGVLLLVAVDDPTPGEVVRRELHHDPVLGEDPDVVLPHLAADVREHLVPVGQLDAEHRVRQRFHNGALELDDSLFLRHVLALLSTSTFVVDRRTSGHEPPSGPCRVGSRGQHEMSPRWAKERAYANTGGEIQPRVSGRAR